MLATTNAAGAREPMPPTIAYWELLWNELHREGWDVNHTAGYETGMGLRQKVSAERDDERFQCSAPTMAQAVELLHRMVSRSCGVPA